MTQDTTLHATTLTQLSSREQLSALMDGALPADETRFLLRRLQHDASLAECWERWRLGGEVMRGLAPTQRLPADFATRVAMALQQDGQSPVAASPRERKPAWLRWGGGAAMAASLAVVVGFVARQPAIDPAGSAPLPQVAAASTVADPPSSPSVPAPSAPPPMPAASDALVAATAIAAAARPMRSRDVVRTQQTARTSSAAIRERESQAIATANLPIDAPQPDIVTRPWPRSVLPQYAGNNALAVGFGDHARAAAPYNPFQSPALAEIAPPAAVQAAPADPADAAGQP
ncbi:MAG: sigma-E factor negative regulatory protein [Thermomonas sp.]